MQQVPTIWSEMVEYLERYKPKLYHLAVTWKPLAQGSLKCNTDGASKGNPGRSAYGFCLRNENGDLVYAQGEAIHKTTNIDAKAIAIREAIYHCLSIW